MTRGPPRIRSPDPTPQRYPEHPLRVNHLGFPGHKTQGRGEGGERAQSAEKLLPKVNLTMSTNFILGLERTKKGHFSVFYRKKRFLPRVSANSTQISPQTSHTKALHSPHASIKLLSPFFIFQSFLISIFTKHHLFSSSNTPKLETLFFTHSTTTTHPTATHVSHLLVSPYLSSSISTIILFPSPPAPPSSRSSPSTSLLPFHLRLT